MARLKRYMVGGLLVIGSALLAGSRCGFDVDVDDDDGFDFDFDKVIVSTHAEPASGLQAGLYG